MSKYDKVNVHVLHFTAKYFLNLLHGDGLDHERLRHSEGSGADITTGTVTLNFMSSHMTHVLINLFSARSVWTHQQSGVMDERRLI